MKRIKVFLILTLTPFLLSAQDKPVLDSTYLANEINEFINSLSEPREKIFAVYLLSGINITNAIPGTRFGNSLAGNDKQYQAQSGFFFMLVLACYCHFLNNQN